MSLKKQAGFCCGAAALALTGVCVADGTETSVDELRARLLAAEAKIAELENGNDANWLTEQRAEQIRGLVHDVLADADTRASLLQSGMNVGYDNGAMIGSADGNWMLKTNLLMQQRFIYNSQDQATGSDTDEYRWGFENTRTKFIMTGHVVNPDWFYKVDVNLGSNGDREDVGNAYLGYNYGNGWSVKVGSMKAPLLREELVEAQYQLAVERSVANYAFTGGYVDGIAMTHAMDTMRYHFAITDGAGTGQTAWSMSDTDFSLTGRLEFLLSGTWEQFEDFTSPPGGEQGIMIGVAGHWQVGESGATDLMFPNGFDPTGGPPYDLTTTGGEELEVWVLTADVSFEWGGANAFVAFTMAEADADVPGFSNQNPWTVVLQGGFYMNDDWELFARYEYGDADAPSGTDVEDLGIFTIGVNRYFAGHNSKWTTDIGFGTEEVDSSFGFANTPAGLTGWRADDAGEDGQLVLRTQWQILF